MNHATVGRRTFEVAGRFAELKPRQLVAIVGLLHAQLPVLELRLRLTLVLLDVRRRPWLFWQLRRMSAESRHELTALAAFCLREPRLTKQLLPVLRVPGTLTRLHGPADAFSNLTFAEFIQAEGYFAAYQRERDVRHLDQLVATLYRPAGGRNPDDRRQPFAPCEVAGRLRAVARLPLATRLTVQLWYGSCRTAWVRKYEGTIFTVPDQQQPAAAKAPDPRETWRDILAERAGSPVQYDEYGRQVLPNVFFDLDLRIRRRLAEQEAIRNAR
ncbi:MAG: hypothetical protein ACRYFX_04635 [Janthinobacterium lividum]